jgi:hypothetical protein
MDMAINGTAFSDTVSVNGGSSTINGTGGAYSSLGNIALGGGADALTVSLASVGPNAFSSDGNILAGTGNDSILLSRVNMPGGAFGGGSVSLEDGNDRLTVSLSTINGAIDAGSGSDSLNLSTIVSLDAIALGSGNDTLIATSINLSGNINAGSGSGTINIANSTIGGSLIYVNNDAAANTFITLTNTSIAQVIDDFTVGSLVQMSLSSVTVAGNVGGNGILTDNSAATSITLNASSVASGILTSNGADLLSVTGSTVNGAINTQDGNDTVVLNTVASLDGVSLGNGNDSLTATSINVSGNVEGGSGSDLLSLTGSTVGGNLYYVRDGASADSSVVLTGTSVAGSVDNWNSSSAARITLTNSTVGGGVHAEDAGTATIVASGSSVGGNVLGAIGANSISISNSTVNANIQTQGGNDTVNLSSVTSIDAISLGAGADTLSAASIRVSGDIDAGTGNSAMTIAGSTIGGNVLFTNTDSSANATLVLSNSSVTGFVDDWLLSSVVNVDIINSTITGNIIGNGVDMVNSARASLHVATSTITSNLATGVGNDTISLNGNTLGGGVDAGSGTDRVHIDNLNQIGGSVSGGSGFDALILQGSSLDHHWTISLAAQATLSGGGTTTVVTDQNYSLVTSFTSGQINGTVSLGASGDTFAVNSFEGIERIVCFGRGTLLRVAGGSEVAVEALRIGDMVETMDDGPQPVRWIGMRRYRADELAATPPLRPIRIAAGALGLGLPARDLVVSPQHRMLLTGKIVKRMFGVDQVLVAAKQLLDLPGIDRLGEDKGVDYFHLMFDRHQLIFAHGAPTESFFAGAEAVAALDHEARAEVLAIFPDLAPESLADGMAPARMMVSGRRARSLASRFANHGRELLGA